ncbi:DUF4279 domain-containing protein [Leptospira langatensis]|uniref:DUF4279 domain-containing protein n=1 Tax=Leptospira langatensis TaxID=2484983 RepID=A0A5F1ZQA2_9LEPT|nr:DUF4279 domain-containing protein [Leptospira langatensis]TGK01756.1 DUF4279 domain-containing protein [Leptospira langatensis]TGL39362.1 DUF4279 domain-containing protein [Leptospira langatensis]
MKADTPSFPRSWALIAISDPGLDVHNLTRELGIRPDLSVNRGVPSISGNQITSPLWQIHSKKDANLPLEEHIWELLERIAPHRKEFQNICSKYPVILYCSVEYNNGSLDETTLSPKTLLLIGNLGLRLAFHAWKLPEKRRRSEDQQ